LRVSLVVEASPLLLHSLGKVDALLNPRNVVILGASDTPGNWSQRVWRNVNRYNFPGPVFRSIRAATRSGTRAAIVRSPNCRSRPITWWWSSGGFRPRCIGRREPGRRSQRHRAHRRLCRVIGSGRPALSVRLKAVIAQTGLAVSGPNCFGNLHARASLMTMPDDRMQRLANGPVAIIGQSGGLAMAIKRSLENAASMPARWSRRAIRPASLAPTTSRITQ